jgi:hypothetical protein
LPGFASWRQEQPEVPALDEPEAPCTQSCKPKLDIRGFLMTAVALRFSFISCIGHLERLLVAPPDPPIVGNQLDASSTADDSITGLVATTRALRSDYRRVVFRPGRWYLLEARRNTGLLSMQIRQ